MDVYVSNYWSSSLEFKHYTQHYFKQLQNTLESIDINEIEKLKELLSNLDKNDTVYIIGNGGSAATASHMVNDFGIGLQRRNKLNISVVSLADNLATCTAIANDTGYENIFYLQLKDKLKPNDVIIAISCSGNSPNIMKAVEYAKELGSTIVGLSGFDGGDLREISTIKIHAQTDKNAYGLVEDAHMVINHLLYSWFIDKDSNAI